MVMIDFQYKIIKTLDYYYRKLKVSGRSIYSYFFSQKAIRPIFVIGCSRAGTTLVYKTLSLSKGIGSVNKETHDLWVSLNPLSAKNWSSHSLSDTDAKQWQGGFISRYFFNQTGKLRFVDKNNQNGLCVRYLNALYDDAVFVYVKRNPGDNIHSLIEGWKRSEEYGTWSDDLPLNINVEEGKYKKWCFFLYPGWRDFVDSPIESVCSMQYLEINKAIIKDLSVISSDRVFEIKYEDIIDNPVKEFSKMFDFCGLEFTENLKTHSENVINNPYNAFSKIQRNKWIGSDNKEIISNALLDNPDISKVAECMGYKKSDYMER